MPTFEESLAASLSRVNTNFEKASADLHEEVAAASKGIEKISNGKASLVLQRNQETETWVVFSLRLKGLQNPELGIGFRIDSKGYPILTGLPVTLLNDPMSKGFRELKNKDEVPQLFEEMASNPDSPLVVKLAFLLRRKDTN